MEEDKKIIKKQGLEIIILSIVVVVLLGLCIYMIFIKKDDKKENNDGNNQAINNNSSQVDDSSNYDPWMNYLLKQNITKIIYDRGIKDYGTGETYPVVEVKIEALKDFFKDFKSHNYKLVKKNVQGRGDGANYINITYVKNGTEYELSIDDGYWTEGNNDQDFMKALESMGYQEEGFDCPFASIWYIFRDEVEDQNTDVNRFDKYFAKYFR